VARVTMLVRNTFTHDTRVEKEARTLAEAGYAVTVVCEGGEGLPPDETRDGISIRRIARPPGHLPGLRFLRYRRSLIHQLLETRPDVLHAHDTDALEPIAVAAQRLHVPFVYDAHELWLGRPPRGRGRLYRSLFTAYYRWVESRRMPAAAAHITVSAPIARWLEQRYGLPPFRLVPNYAELDAEAPPHDLRSLLGEDVPSRAPLILHIGAVMPDRGIEQLIAALGRASTAHLVLLGGGHHLPGTRRATVELGLGARVHFLPAVDARTVVSYAASATIGVVPILPTTLNNRYSLPNKLFQYLAAGIPVVVSDLPQLREIVESTGAGRAVDTSNVDALGDCLAAILADEPSLRSMGERARQAAEEQYNWSWCANALLEVYAGLRPVESGL